MLFWVVVGARANNQSGFAFSGLPDTSCFRRGGVVGADANNGRKRAGYRYVLRRSIRAEGPGAKIQRESALHPERCRLADVHRVGCRINCYRTGRFFLRKNHSGRNSDQECGEQHRRKARFHIFVRLDEKIAWKVKGYGFFRSTAQLFFARTHRIGAAYHHAPGYRGSARNGNREIQAR